MSSWLTESDWRETRRDSPAWPGLTLNIAFLNEIKEVSQKPTELIGQIKQLLSQRGAFKPIRLLSLLSQLRDELETQFTLEEFYGYFKSAQVTHPQVAVRAESLQSQHEQIYLDVCDLVELAETLVYRESTQAKVVPAIVSGFKTLIQNFNRHEQEEFDLMMRLCNDELGVGD